MMTDERETETGHGVLIARCNPAVGFGEAFAAARSAGAHQFTWRGRAYHTRRADDPVAQKVSAILGFTLKEETE